MMWASCQRYITVESHVALPLQQQVSHPSFLSLHFFGEGCCWESRPCFNISFGSLPAQPPHSPYWWRILLLPLTQMGIKCLAEGHLDGICWILSIYSLIFHNQTFTAGLDSETRQPQACPPRTFKPDCRQVVSFPNYCSNQTFFFFMALYLQDVSNT